ncbi:MAG: pyrroline-5-carboxylate reductase [Candidatus Endobugula sp.]|jgi:pyrroline-5-carboxylate reductase
MATLTFIGAGNMSSSIIGGLIEQGYCPDDITASDPNTEGLQAIHHKLGIRTTTDNNTACASCDVIVLAVKPQVLKQVVTGLQGVLAQRSQAPMIISIAAGISCDHIRQWIGRDIAVVRCMPNTPALVGQGASGLYANTQTSNEQKAIAEQLMGAVGYATWVAKESLIDTVTAISGSAPAYFFLMMEAMIDAGVKQGLDRESATQLTLQTAMGAATLAKNSDVAVDELRRRVTSPGGTTEQAILSYEQAGLRNIVEDAMQRCADRSVEMAKEFS